MRTLYTVTGMFRFILAPKAAEILARVKFRGTYARAILYVILVYTLTKSNQCAREFHAIDLQCCCCWCCYYYCYYIHYYTHKHTHTHYQI